MTRRLLLAAALAAPVLALAAAVAWSLAGWPFRGETR
jgi:hypothetical protein